MPNNESWNNTQKILAFLIVIALIVVILIWIFHPPTGDAASNSVLNVLVGALVGMAGMVATFYFGSSQGSKDKDQALSAIATGTGNGGGSTSTATVTAPTATSPGTATVTSSDPAHPPPAKAAS
jgi:hypothetical protein